MLFETFSSKLHQIERALLGDSNVVGVGWGWKEKDNCPTATPAWRVYVRQKVPLACVPKSERIPARWNGFATDVITAGKPSAMIGVSAGQLAPGTIISNLRNVAKISHSSEQPAGLGTLGFLALVNGRRERELVLVSNRHVLLAHGAGKGDPIYAPIIERRGDEFVIDPGSLEPVAEIADEGMDSNYSYQFRSESSSDYFVDCASARVLDSKQISRHWKLSENGELTWPHTARRAHPLDVVGRRAPRVRKIGGQTGFATGTLVDVSAPVETESGRRLRNLVIRGSSPGFVTPGDSGALVINDSNEAIGLIWGRNDHDSTVAYACHIHPVLHRLNVSVLPPGITQ